MSHPDDYAAEDHDEDQDEDEDAMDDDDAAYEEECAPSIYRSLRGALF
jgi:hypothetical protein